MALPTMYYRKSRTATDQKRYLETYTAGASTTTEIIAAADIGADEQVVIWWFMTSSSVAFAFEFEDTSSTDLTKLHWHPSSRTLEIGSPDGEVPIIMGTVNKGVQIRNPVATAQEFEICWSVVDRSKAPYLE